MMFFHRFKSESDIGSLKQWDILRIVPGNIGVRTII